MKITINNTFADFTTAETTAENLRHHPVDTTAETITEILRHHPECRVVILSVRADEDWS